MADATANGGAIPVVRAFDPDDLPPLRVDAPVVLVHGGPSAGAVYGRTIVQLVAARHLGVDPAVIEIDRADRGKPRLGGAPSPFAFNLSDADDHVAAAFGLGLEIGVDIERADRRTVEPERFARRVLSVAERAAIEGLGGDALDRALIRMWTRKEAVLKAAGHGLRRELADIDTVADVVMLDGSPWNCWTTNWRDRGVGRWGQLPTR